MLTYVAIVSDRIHKTVAALLGATLMIFLLTRYGEPEWTQLDAFHAIDFNVIFLLAGMMMIANIMGKTGAFQLLAIKAAKLARGNPLYIMILLCIITAVLSAFIDNVTTVVLLVPVTLSIAATLRVNPIPFLIAEIISSNIGGTATLIGDPPNIMVGSHAGLSFMDFVANLAPIVLIILVVFLFMCRYLFRRDLTVEPELRDKVMELEDKGIITDPDLLRKCLIVLGIVILGFLLHDQLDLEVATIALFGAALLLLITRIHPFETLRDVEWPTLFFFVGLFIVVGGIVHVGLIDILTDDLLDLTHGSLTWTSLSLLWFSGVASGIIDNIPYTATMIPLVDELGEHMLITPLWWSLALGACLGGNFTVIGASANVLVAHSADRAGYHISFVSYLKYGVIASVLSLVLGSVYIWLRYLL